MTIVTRGRDCALGTAVDGNVILSNPGHAVAATWNQIPQHFANVLLDEFVILPNHVHGIIMIVEDERAVPGDMGGFRRGEASGNCVTCGQARNMPDASPLPHGTIPGSLGAILQNFKSIFTRRINGMQNTPGLPFWQFSSAENGGRCLFSAPIMIGAAGRCNRRLTFCLPPTGLPNATPTKSPHVEPET